MASGGEQGIRFARLRSLGRSRSQQSTGLLLCTARPSNPLLTFCKQKSSHTKRCNCLFHGGEQGIRTLEQVIARYTISNRAPSASSDNSPYLFNYVIIHKGGLKIKTLHKNISYFLNTKNIAFYYPPINL